MIEDKLLTETWLTAMKGKNKAPQSVPGTQTDLWRPYSTVIWLAKGKFRALLLLCRVSQLLLPTSRDYPHAADTKLWEEKCNAHLGKGN